MNALGARVRLVKGAYREPRDVAFQQKAEVDAAYVELMQMLLARGTYPAIATHDPAMIARDDGVRRAHAASRRTRSSFRCCTAFAATCRRRSPAEGYPFRVYVPFGKEWFPYFMRRLGERPANVGFVRAEHPRRTARRSLACTVGRASVDRTDRPGGRAEHVAARETILRRSRTPETVQAGAAGPKSTDGMPASARIAASVQNDMPTGALERPVAASAAPTARASGCVGVEPVRRPVRHQPRVGLELRIVAREAARESRRLSASTLRSSSPATVRRSICSVQRSG